MWSYCQVQIQFLSQHKWTQQRSHSEVRLQVLESSLTLVHPLKRPFKNLKKCQTFFSSFKDKPVKGSNLSGKGLNFFDISRRLHIQYCLNLIRIYFNPPMRNHKSKKFPQRYSKSAFAGVQLHVVLPMWCPNLIDCVMCVGVWWVPHRVFTG